MSIEGMSKEYVFIPSSNENALEKLKDEDYLRERYQHLRSEGQSVEQAFTAIWNMVEITPNELEWITMLLAAELKREYYPTFDKLYAKLWSFHWTAAPEAETYVLTKVLPEP
jgi:hypothetical protein